MLKKILVFIPLALSVGAFQAQALTLPFPNVGIAQQEISSQTTLAQREMSLTNRYGNQFVNDVFADNMLLTLAYLSKRVSDADRINWEEVRKPQEHRIVLKPGEVFAFHDTVQPEYSAKTVSTTNAHFNADQGFRSSGSLFGDGVCHLASIINWAARDAGLAVVAPVNHDFATIPDVPREYGTAIYYSPVAPATSQQQNLYIQNTTESTITFVITSQKETIRVSVEKEK